jgi:hypothetical protein
VLGTLPGVVIGSLLRVFLVPGPRAFRLIIAALLLPLGLWLCWRTLRPVRRHPGSPPSHLADLVRHRRHCPDRELTPQDAGHAHHAPASTFGSRASTSLPVQWACGRFRPLCNADSGDQQQRGAAMNVSANTDDRAVGAVADRSELPGADRRWLWTLMRVVVVLQAVDTFLEAVFAGRFLSGDFAMLGLHQDNGTFGVFVLSLLQIVTSVLVWRLARGRPWLVVMSSLLAVAEVLQMLLGFWRILGVHIPLAVLIIATMGWLALWVCTHRPDDPVFQQVRK